MRKWFCVVGSFVLLLASPTRGRAQAAPWQWFTANRLSVASAGSIRARDEQWNQLIGEIPSPGAESLGMNWRLSAELRDASCPSCRFPDFALPETFDCLGDCSDGHWRVSNRTASAEVKPDATFGLQAMTLKQDTTQAAVSCDQEYNLFVEQGNLWPFTVPPQGWPTLDVSWLLVQAYQRIEEAVHVAECPDSRALASTLIGVQFFNPQTGQLLNYQIITLDSRGAQFDGLWWSFVAAGGETIFGVNDSYHNPALEPGGDGFILSVEIAERLKDLLQANPLGLSTEPRSWRISGLYGGSYTNGGAMIKSTQGFFNLEY